MNKKELDTDIVSEDVELVNKIIGAELEAEKNGLIEQDKANTSDSAPSGDTAIQPLMLTVQEVQALLRIGRNKTYELIRSGELPSIRIGRQIRISKTAIEQFIVGKNQ